MPLPSSGAISLDQMHVEAGGTSGTQCSINDADIRDMISKGSGVQMSFSEWYGASAGPFIEAGGDPSFWNVGLDNAFGSFDNVPGLKAYWYNLMGAGWYVEELSITLLGWDNGNGWGSELQPHTVYQITIDGQTYSNYPIPFGRTGTFGDTVYGRAIADFFSYSHMHGGGSYAQTGREARYTPNYDSNIGQHGGYANTVAQVAQDDYPYYTQDNLMFYTFKVGDPVYNLQGENYGGFACEPYRTDSPTYPF